MYYKDDIYVDIGYVKIPKPEHKELKGFTHIWGYFINKDVGACIGSIYKKECKNGLYSATITNSSNGWKVYLFYGGAKWKGWNFLYENLADAEEQANLYLNNKLVLD